jgi:hypothetical protein
MNPTAVFYALIAAALFGISTPVAKVLIGSTHPVVLAGLLYCGAGIGVALLRKVPWSIFASHGAPEASLTRSDVPWLGGAVIAGGVVGPILLLVGLTHTDASTASLLLTLEGVATALMAWFIFHELRPQDCYQYAVPDRRGDCTPGQDADAGVSLVISRHGSLCGLGLITIHAQISLADPLQMSRKAPLPASQFVAGYGPEALPDLPTGVVATIVGFLCYGVSLGYSCLRCDIWAARVQYVFSLRPSLGL